MIGLHKIETASRDEISSVQRERLSWSLHHAYRNVPHYRLAFDAAGVCWGPYQSFRQLVAEDPRCSPANPMFAAIDQPGLGKFLAPGSPLEFGAFSRTATAPAPVLGQHTEEVLAHHLGLGSGEIARLHDTGIVAGPARTD